MSYHSIIPAVHLLVVRDGELLMLRRANTGYRDGFYSVPAGHVEPGESASVAMIREAAEEIGMVIPGDGLAAELVVHRKSGDSERVDFFFSTADWAGEITNKEPNKCDDLRWFSLNRLPPNVVPYVRSAVESYLSGASYLEFGWK